MEEYIGVIKMFAGNYVPEGYMLCQGQTLSITENEVLYAVIGNTYGGDIQNNNFQLPNLCGRTVKGTGVNTSGTQTVTLGEVGGNDSIVPTLSYANQMPCAILDSQYLGLNYIICVNGMYPSRQ
jgi:microcystin-dependent protein